MKQRAGTVLHIATPLKAWAQRFAFLLLVGASFGLMLMGKADTLLFERARIAVTDAVTPILDAVSAPVATLADIIEEGQALANLREQNALLRQENERLMQWQVVARRLEADNAALRDLLNLVPDPDLRYVSARVVGDHGSAFVRTVLINAGLQQGVAKGQAAVTGEGLAGRVVEAGNRSARVLLITDINSRLPVVVSDTRHRAILAGDNSPLPRLLYKPLDATLMPGMRIVTSGQGGLFPPGLPVGIIETVSEAGITVRTFVDWNRLEFMRLIDYDLARTLSGPEPVVAAEVGR